MPSSYSQYAAGVANLAQTKAVPCLVLPGEGLSLDLQQFRMAQLTKQALKWETLPWRSEEKLWPMRWPLSFSFTCPYLCESKMWFMTFRMLCENTQLFPSFISERQLEKKPSVILAAVALPLSMSYSWPGTRISCETPAWTEHQSTTGQRRMKGLPWWPLFVSWKTHWLFSGQITQKCDARRLR